jgi:CheY-like chemotaxis protein
MSDPWRLLLIDDNPDDRVFVRRALARELDALEVQEAGDAESLARAFEAGPFDVVITDYALGFTDGFIVLDTLKSKWPECPVILCTGTLSEEIAVKALRKGLDDYVLKDPQRRSASPVTFAPGLAKLTTRPAATGSPIDRPTIGTVTVPLLAAATANGLHATIVSTPRPMKSRTNSGGRCRLPAV